MLFEILKKHMPVRLNVVYFKITQGKRKTMVYTHKSSHAILQAVAEPFSNLRSRPVFTGAWRRQHLNGRMISIRLVHPKPFQARVRSLRSRIVYSDIAFE